MNAKSLLFLTATLNLLATAPVVEAQSAKVYRTGFISPASSSSMASRVEAFNRGMRDLGYIEGRNIMTEYRWADGNDAQLLGFAGELIGLKVDILVVHGAAAAQAARKATRTIPIVCFACGDVVSTGLVSNLARPGGNVTGITIVAPEVSGKRLELLQQVVPSAKRVAVLWNPGNPVAVQELMETETAARSLGIQLKLVGVQRASDLEAAVSSIRKPDMDALIVLSDAMLYGQRKEIAALAIAKQLPAVSYTGEFAKAGGLMAYGPDVLALSVRAASYVDKILRGAKPADLAIEQPTKFELVINLKTASALGLSIPSSVLLRADETIP